MSSTDFYAVESVAETPVLVATPHHDLEKRLLGIWMQVLERTGIGVNDNFYDVGGDSLKAVQVISQIETELNVSIPPSRLYEASTVAKQARVIEAIHDGVLPAEDTQAIFEICPSPSGRPLFCFPGNCGGVAPFYPLAERFRAEHGVTVVLYSYLEQNAPPPAMRDLAASCLQGIKSVQPAGPYDLAGYCFGASVAYEVARQLQAAGEEVSTLALWDPEPGPASWSLRKRLIYRKNKLTAFLRSLAGPLRPASPPQEVNVPVPDKIARYQIAAHEILQSYRHRPYAGRLSLFYSASGHQPPDVPYWRGLARGGFECHSIPGNHFTMLQEPHVASLAELLGAQLQES